jgi:hypothetical protein
MRTQQLAIPSQDPLRHLKRGNTNQSRNSLHYLQL